jgi:tRNA (cytidine/uridine-2'-O-)-methyltransferase
MFHIVLVEPEIPPNTGNVARLCAANNLQLHLVKPLGFDIDDRAVRRAGLDYWDQVQLSVHENIEALWKVIAARPVYFFHHQSSENFV